MSEGRRRLRAEPLVGDRPDGFETLGGPVVDRLNGAPRAWYADRADGFDIEVRSVDGAR